MTIQIEDEKPQQGDFAKYLGVYFDNNLSWKKYIEMKSIKVNKELGKWEENVWLLTGKAIEKSLLACGGAPKTHLIKIERSLNKAVRIILFKGKFESA